MVQLATEPNFLEENSLAGFCLEAALHLLKMEMLFASAKKKTQTFKMICFFFFSRCFSLHLHNSKL